MLASRLDSPPTVIVSPSCSDVTVPEMRCLPTLTPQCVLTDAGAKLAPSPPLKTPDKSSNSKGWPAAAHGSAGLRGPRRSRG